MYHWLFIPYAIIFIGKSLYETFYGVADFISPLKKFVSTYVPFQKLEFILLETINFLAKNYVGLATVVFLVLGYKVYRWVYRRFTRHQEAHHVQSAIARDYSRFVRAVSLNLPNPGQPILEKNRNCIIDAAAIFIRNGTDRLSQLLHWYTGGPTHISFKSFAPEIEEVRTHHRIVGGGRSLVDDEIPAFNYKENTAFASIIDDRSTNYFFSNNLRRLEKRGGYKNIHENWKNHYNATVVVPTTDRQSPAQVTKISVNGFVCVDNRIGKFDNKSCVDILNCFASQCYTVMQVLGYLEEPENTNNTPSKGAAND